MIEVYQKVYGDSHYLPGIALSNLAGYAILKAQASPAVSWLKSAREDLIAIYDALGQPQKAEPFRAEPGSGSK